MKYAIILLLMIFALSAGAQNQQTSEQKSQNMTLESMLSLDGKAYKVTFVPRRDAAMQSSGRALSESQNMITDDQGSIMSPGVNREEMFKDFPELGTVILSFDNGKLYAPFLWKTPQADDGCPYKVNTWSGEMVAISAVCRMEPEFRSEYENRNEKAPETVYGNEQPSDEKKYSNYEMQRENTNPLMLAETATISAFVDGSKIRGTLSWTNNEGNTLQYSFSGSLVKSMDSHPVGMR